MSRIQNILNKAERDGTVRRMRTTTEHQRRTRDAVAAEQYRALRTRVVHADNGAPVHMLLVTSPGRGEGKSITAANLALTMAQEYQQRICLVDANLRHPQVHRLFDISEAPGLADVAGGRAARE